VVPYFRTQAALIGCSLLQSTVKDATDRKVGPDVEGDGGRHGDGHKARVALRQHIAQSADDDRSGKETRAQRHAVLRQCCHSLRAQQLLNGAGS
jgi:hypothetical protein